MANTAFNEPEDVKLTEEDIAAFLDGYEDAEIKIRSHIANCSYCRDFIHILQSIPPPERNERVRLWRCSGQQDTSR